MSKWNNKKTKDLMETILQLKSIKEAKSFFRDLMTEKELIELGNRWKAARMLDENISYSEIEKETGLSSTTVARVSKWLKEGKGGYQKMINRLRKNNFTKNNSHHHDDDYLPGKKLR